VKLRRIGLAGVVLGLATFVVASVGAGPVDPNAPLPPGHPAMGVATPSASAGAAAKPPATASAPAGEQAPHGAEENDQNAPDGPDGEGPDVDEDAAPPPGHGSGEAPEVRDRSVRAPDLRPGTIEVHVHDGSEQPLAHFPIRLGIMKQDVAEGDSRSQRDATTDDKGVVLFSGLEMSSAFSYRVTATRDYGTFASEPVRLEPTSGQRVLLHVFPVTHDLRESFVGMRSIVYVSPREDVFQIEANFQVLNIGKQAWVPEHVKLELPAGAKAFRSADSMKDTRVEKAEGNFIELLGTFAPGEHEVGFQFQLPNDHTKAKEFRMGLLPHVAEVRVIAERARGMSLHVEGFPEAEPVEGRDGSRLLLTAKHMARGDAAMESVQVGLDNLPVPATGRWYALVLAGSIAVLGLFEASRRGPATGRAAPRALPVAERKEAERLLLDELVALERLRRREGIGPQTYREARAELLDALSRLVPAETARSS
jgi:hypothetical protein